MNLDTFIHQSPYSNIAYNINGVYFFLNEDWKKVAINVSGGADSAMLTFILCKIISENNLDIEIVALSHLRLWKTRPWQIYDARRVIDFIKQFYPNVKITHHENFMAPELNCKDPVIEDENGHMKTGDRVQVRAWNDYMCYTNQIPAWFGGITLNPTDNLITQKPFDRNKEFEYSEEDLKKLIRRHNGVYICHPFSFTDKEWIMQQYKNFDRIDLLKLTHSCEGDDNLYPEVYQGLDYRTYVPDQIVPECGKCFWCQERHWGMKKVFGEIINR
jgi:hypothetical protein